MLSFTKKCLMITLNDKTYTCPIDVTLSRIGGKWKLLILAQLHYQGRLGYSAIRDNLPGVSEKMLSQQLRELESDQLISKKKLSLKPLRVEYSLSTQGETLVPLFEFTSSWGIRYLKDNGIAYLKDQSIYK
jgi:DNA-binding HxlR family transcriptional regulator